jgi:hypothetical protein
MAATVFEEAHGVGLEPSAAAGHLAAARVSRLLLGICLAVRAMLICREGTR